MQHEPLDTTPPTPSERSFWAAMLDLFRIRRNKADQRQADAAERNRALREAEAARTLRQPGASPEAVEKALRVLGRVGKGEA